MTAVAGREEAMRALAFAQRIPRPYSMIAALQAAGQSRREILAVLRGWRPIGPDELRRLIKHTHVMLRACDRGEDPQAVWPWRYSPKRNSWLRTPPPPPPQHLNKGADGPPLQVELGRRPVCCMVVGVARSTAFDLGPLAGRERHAKRGIAMTSSRKARGLVALMAVWLCLCSCPFLRPDRSLFRRRSALPGPRAPLRRQQLQQLSAAADLLLVVFSRP